MEYTTKLNGSHIYALSLLKYILEIYLVFVNEKLSHRNNTTTKANIRSEESSPHQNLNLAIIFDKSNNFKFFQLKTNLKS